MSSSSTSMSKEKLKNELQSRNIPLPPTGSKKEVYVQLYQKYFISNAQTREPRASEFSSDEEDAYKYAKGHSKEKTIFTSINDYEMTPTVTLDGVCVNISELSDDELRQYLLKNNVTPGPILDSTRTVYERKLARILMGDVEGELPNGQYRQTQEENEYSDSDQDEMPPPPPIVSPSNNSVNRKKKHEDSPIIHHIEDPESVLSQRNYSVDTPTARRSLRENISYTPVDRNRYADLLRRKNEETVSDLASNVVENTPEPIKEMKQKNNSNLMKKLLFLMLLLVIATIVVYCSMEASNTDEISHIPSSN